MSRIPKIRVICDTSLEYFRNIILGVRHYAFTTGQLEIEDRWDAALPTDWAAWVRDNQIDGIIVQANTRELESRLLALDIPVVNVGNILDRPRLPLVTQDDFEVGRMAAAHLLECGCSAYACWGRRDGAFSAERIQGFETELARANPMPECHVMQGPGILEESGELLVTRMENWLRPLPRPLGIFAVMDVFAVHLITALRRLGWRLGEDVAVLGSGNDKFVVQYENTPLSSVDLPSRQVGYEAASLLHRLLDRASGKAVESLRLKPSGITVRESTDIVFMDDPAVARALAFIRGNRGVKLSVADITRAAGLTRIPLQRRFKERLGRTIRQEVQRSRIELAKSLLRSNDETIAWVAERCRFPNSQRFAVVFRKQTRMSPGQYRKAAHPAAGMGPAAGEHHSSGSLD